MRTSIPTKQELRCAGTSFIIGQILLFVAWILHSIDFDAYDVRNEQDVISLHKIMSSSTHRNEVEIAVALVWVAFPLLLFGLHGFRKHSFVIYESTLGESFIYLYEKAFIMWMVVMMIIFPALSLVSVSFDWSFYESTDIAVPTGYYIQLYAVLFELELFDCACVADAVFMISLWILGLIMLTETKKGNPKFRQLAQIHTQKPKLVVINVVVTLCCTLILFVIFIIILFEFAQSGFFSPSGYAKALIVFSFFCKILVAFKLIKASKSTNYDMFKQAINDFNGSSASINVLMRNTNEAKLELIEIDNAK
eukprot:14218_1